MGLEQRIYCRKECGRRKTEVIHIGQLKIPVEKVMAEASKQDLKKGRLPCLSATLPKIHFSVYEM